MRLQVFLAPQLAKVQVIPGVGKDGIQRHLAGDAVVAMPSQVAAVGFGGQHHIGLDPADLPHQLLAERGGILQFPVRIAQLRQPPNAQQIDGVPLFLFPDRGQFLGRNIRLGAAPAAVGAEDKIDFRALPNPAGYRPAAPEFRIIRMGRNHQNPLGYFIHSRFLPGAGPLWPAIIAALYYTKTGAGAMGDGAGFPGNCL